MAHTFEHTLDAWATNGTKSAPSSTLKSTGFTGGMKPPASVFNYQWDKIAKAISELQQYALTEDPSGGIWQRLATVAISGNYTDLLNKPDLKAVATSGSFNDLTDIPNRLAEHSVHTINITSASWSGSTYTTTMPSRYLLWNGCNYTSNSCVFLLVDNGKAYGIYAKYRGSSYSVPILGVCGETSIRVGLGSSTELFDLDFSATQLICTKSYLSTVMLGYLQI